jgi:DNA polymerase III subunit gamma/tau
LQLELALLGATEIVPAAPSLPPFPAKPSRPEERGTATASKEVAPAGGGRKSPPPEPVEKPAVKVQPATAEHSPAQPAAPAASSPPQAPTVPAEPTAPAGTGPTLQSLLDRWAEVVEVVSKSPPTKPLILACRPISLEGRVVTLGFPEAQSFLKDVAERRKSVLEDGVGRVLGVPVSVRCVAANVEVAPLGKDADGARLLTEFKRIYADDIVEVDNID